MKLYISLLSLLFISVSCKNTTQKSTADNQMAMKDPITTPAENGMEHAYFASGCFWCVEAVYESVKGVKEARSGYSGGTQPNPTYKQVSSGTTDYAEAVEVIYDPTVVSYQSLVDVFFGSQDPTTANRQGPDRGTQYRSIAFYQNEEQKQIIENTIKRLNESTYDGEIVTQVLPFQKFWEAEDYHQDYERNHMNDPYISSVSIPRINRFKKKFPELLKENSTH
ncbi:MAG TPA: peptide-methionine (S)-S-oxide reductase [Leeuwenhoekiella sp.]|nr:peptide-methionine (S)-S-oxide reductase [Leeuwenhoekiella sp.]